MKKAFTLIELMVVISIIGILAAITLPRFSDVSQDAKVAQVQANLANLRTSIGMFYAKNDYYPVFSDADVKAAPSESDISSDGSLSDAFTEFYSKSLMPETPASSDTSFTNQVTGVRDNSGGWLYLAAEGNIYANLPDGNYTGDTLKEIWNEDRNDSGGNPGDGDYDFISGEDLKDFIDEDDKRWEYNENDELIYNGDNSGKGELNFTEENTGLSEINEINIESRGEIDSLTGFPDDSYVMTLVPGTEYIYNISFTEPQSTPVSTGLKWDDAGSSERAISGIEFK